jgi:hypothetical protein
MQHITAPKTVEEFIAAGKTITDEIAAETADLKELHTRLMERLREEAEAGEVEAKVLPRIPTADRKTLDVSADRVRTANYIDAYWGREYNGKPLEVMTEGMETVLTRYETKKLATSLKISIIRIVRCLEADAMIHHFNCPESFGSNDDPLIFDWDDETGEITGPSADFVLACFKHGNISAHPIPWDWDLTSTKSRTDIAAVIGSLWDLPPDFVDDYPKYEGGDGAIRDEAGNVVGYVHF